LGKLAIFDTIFNLLRCTSHLHLQRLISMGVKSFDSFIRQRVAGEPLTLARSDQPRCFVVDGNGFLYYLYNARQLDVWHGVDPSAIKSAVEWFIQPFR
jgi:hypothetical protein